ncbi:MAG: class I SAM-dependent methyltransferase [Myxococcota bacterium]
MPAPRWLRSQLSGPHGWLARPMAHLLNRGNRSSYAHALARLSTGPGDHVLELGFGGGLALPPLLASGAHVTGVEPAVAMRARALRKHAWDIAEGRLQILDARAEALPDGPFTHALSLNTVYFWDDVPAGMAELHRTVRGTVLLGVSSPEHLVHMGFPDSGFRVEPPAFYGDALADAGFTVRLEPPDAEPGCTLVIGVRRAYSSR